MGTKFDYHDKVLLYFQISTIAESEDSQESVDSVTDSQKRREILSRRPSYRYGIEQLKEFRIRSIKVYPYVVTDEEMSEGQLDARFRTIQNMSFHLELLLSNKLKLVIQNKALLNLNMLCLTLHDPIDYSPPVSSVHGIFQARILECIAISFSQGSS